MCISHKRMSQHLRGKHGGIDVTDVDGNARHVYLQTFFKGNKIRYFEVKPRDETYELPPASQPKIHFVKASQQDQEDGLQQTPVTGYGTQAVARAPGTNLPMKTLLYLHHYCTIAGLSLNRGGEPATLWTHDLPLQGSAQPFLMHGMLGVAAFHQALMASDPGERRRHQSAGLLHQSLGLATFRSIVDHPTLETSTALTAFSRLLGVQSLVQALLEAGDSPSQANDLQRSGASEILEFLLLLRGGVEILLSMQNLLPAGSGFILSAEVRHGLENFEFSPDALVTSAPYLANELCTRLVWSEEFPWPDGWAFRLKTLAEVGSFMRLCVSMSKVTDTQTITDSWIVNAIPELAQSVGDVQHFTRTLAEAHRSAELFRSQPRLDHERAPCPVLLCYPHIPVAI